MMRKSILLMIIILLAGCSKAPDHTGEQQISEIAPLITCITAGSESESSELCRNFLAENVTDGYTLSFGTYENGEFVNKYRSLTAQEWEGLINAIGGLYTANSEYTGFSATENKAYTAYFANYYIDKEEFRIAIKSGEEKDALFIAFEELAQKEGIETEEIR